MSHNDSPTRNFTENRFDAPASWIRTLSNVGLCAAAGGMGWGFGGNTVMKQARCLRVF